MAVSKVFKVMSWALTIGDKESIVSFPFEERKDVKIEISNESIFGRNGPGFVSVYNLPGVGNFLLNCWSSFTHIERFLILNIGEKYQIKCQEMEDCKKFNNLSIISEHPRKVGHFFCRSVGAYHLLKIFCTHDHWQARIEKLSFICYSFSEAIIPCRVNYNVEEIIFKHRYENTISCRNKDIYISWKHGYAVGYVTREKILLSEGFLLNLANEELTQIYTGDDEIIIMGPDKTICLYGSNQLTLAHYDEDKNVLSRIMSLPFPCEPKMSDFVFSLDGKIAISIYERDNYITTFVDPYHQKVVSKNLENRIQVLDDSCHATNVFNLLTKIARNTLHKDLAKIILHYCTLLNLQ